MTLVRTFVAGMLVPAVLSPFVLLFFVLSGEVQAIAQLPFLYFGPTLWGLWNVFFMWTQKLVPVEQRKNKIGVYGAAYGLLAALLNGLYFEFTSVLVALSDSLIFAAIVGYPILLFFVWKYVVNALNMYFEVY